MGMATQLDLQLVELVAVLEMLVPDFKQQKVRILIFDI